MGRGNTEGRTEAALPHVGEQLSLFWRIGVEQIDSDLYLYNRDDGWAAHPNDGRMEPEL